MLYISKAGWANNLLGAVGLARHNHFLQIWSELSGNKLECLWMAFVYQESDANVSQVGFQNPSNSGIHSVNG